MVDRFNNVKQILQGFKQAPIFEVNPGSLQMELERASIKKKLQAIEDAKKIAMRNRIENATAKGLLPEGAEEFLNKEFRKQFSSIDDIIKNAPQEAKRLASGYREMLRRTAPIQEVKQLDANKIASLIENAQQGVNKNIIIKSNGTKIAPKNVTTVLPNVRGALTTAVPYLPVAGSIYDIVAGGKKVISPTKEGDLWRGLGQTGLGVVGLVPGFQWTSFAKKAKNITNIPVKQTVQAFGIPIAGALVGEANRNKSNKMQSVPLDVIEEPVNENTAGGQNMGGVQYTVLPEPPNSNAIAKDMAKIIGEMSGNRGIVPAGNVEIQETTPQQQVADDSIARALIEMYDRQYQEMQKPQTQALQEYKRKLPYANISDALMRAGLASYAQAYDIPGLANAYSGSEYTNRLAKNYELDQAIASMPMNRFNAVNTLAGNIAVANQMGMRPSVAMADKDIQKVLTAFNQSGSRENVANINAMAKMYGADRGVDIANIKAMAQALSTDARLSATERMYYANLANKLDIARMNATVAPYRFGYDITPEYVDLINSGASIQAPIVPSTNVLGGMLGNQGFTNQLDFNRINRGN